MIQTILLLAGGNLLGRVGNLSLLSQPVWKEHFKFKLAVLY